MSDTPLVSVLMSVHNCERYIALAVQSILDQTIGEFEIILIDDGSTDGTHRILRKFEQADRRIRLISQENKGIIYSANKGLAIARGELIARMDGDDISLPNRFAKQVQFLNEHQECVAVGCNTQMIDAEGYPVCLQEYPTDDAAIFAMCLKGYGGIPNPGAMFRRKAVQAIGGYRDLFFDGAEDLDLWLRLADTGVLANLPDVLLAYRLHLQSISFQRRKLQIRNAQRAVTEACARRNISPPDSKLFGKEATGAGSEIVLAGWCHLALRDGNLKSAMKLALSMVKSGPFRLQPYLHLLKVIAAFVESPVHHWILHRFSSASVRAKCAKVAMDRRHALHGEDRHREALSAAWQSFKWYPTLSTTLFLGGSAFRYTKSLYFLRANKHMLSDFSSTTNSHTPAKRGGGDDV